MRNGIFAVATVLLEQGQDVVELGARVGREQLLQVGVDSLPRADLLRRILNPWNGLATMGKKVVRLLCYFGP